MYILNLGQKSYHYKKGIDAYSKERWSECISKFEETLHLFKLYKTIEINCRLKCESQKQKAEVEEIEDIGIYEKFLNNRLCITKCQSEGFDEARLNSFVPESVINEMTLKKPYEYLHICYFQMNALPKAASAAYTYLVANPEDEKMKQNVKYYIDQPEVDINEIIDLESEDYKILYNVGLKAYNAKKWGETVANMEESLTDYLSWENMCRADCQHQTELEWSPEFTVTVSNYMTALLMCKQKCQDKLKYLNFNSGIEFLADLLNYLQISYYHLGRIEDAAKAVESYLLLLPNDEDILSNKNIYSSLTDQKNFVEKSDIAYYFKRDKYEKRVLDTFYNSDINNEINSMKE
ncbi:unnamed protein product [Parnassius apollo]|uniref:(apollo) hypothetical protein n=1 Tax=Parnassius apollo TaxID=110799 RepID=A0A8S3WTL8_PARAO|nr:unnamed protein product [Parnassius apollo]